MILTTALVSLLAALTAVSAAPVESSKVERDSHRTPITHVIEVGKDGLKYTPPFITAAVGDQVQLEFFAANHTLVQSTFDKPCEPIHDAIFAGFQPSTITKNTTGLVTFKTATFEVKTDKPLWFYCAQANHCQKGMTFAINPPAGSVDKFNQVAATKQKNIAPYGGPHGVELGLVERFI